MQVKVDEGRASRRCIATQSGLGELTEMDIGQNSLRSNLCVLGRRSPAAVGGEMGRAVRHSVARAKVCLA
jgi:hypothetical protein